MSKSICKGGFNEISINEIISLFQERSCTGQSMGTNLDSYLEPLNPLKVLPGAHALHGNKQIHTQVVLPDNGMIRSMNQAAVTHLIHIP